MSSARAREEASFRRSDEVFRFWLCCDCMECAAMIGAGDARAGMVFSWLGELRQRALCLWRRSFSPAAGIQPGRTLSRPRRLLAGSAESIGSHGEVQITGCHESVNA